jgi:glutamine synthetase
VESLKTILDEENVKLFERHHVLSKTELHARTDVLLEVYSKSINIEARTMLQIAKRQILPAASEYSRHLGKAAKAVSDTGVSADTHIGLLKELCTLIKILDGNIKALEKAVNKASKTSGVVKHAESYRDDVVPAMNDLRATADELEKIVDAELWPLPTYAEMLFLNNCLKQS